MPAGRPLKFNSVEELKHLIDLYFFECDETKTAYTITGLALALNTCRQTLLDYEKRDEFLDTIKNAKLRVENDYELSLRARGSAGDIFGLKNFGWKDKQEVAQSNRYVDKDGEDLHKRDRDILKEMGLDQGEQHE